MNKKRIKKFFKSTGILGPLYRLKIFIVSLFLSSIRDKIKYIKNIKTYKKLQKQQKSNNFPIKIKYLYPVLKDYRSYSGTTNGQYFLQDLIVARKIFESSVTEHIDIGSRIDGFIAHISSFLERVIVLDVRPNIDNLFNIEFKQEDATNLIGISDNSVESISSLHAIEHFGLGRYGDPIDPQADIKAMMSLKRVLRWDGVLYFSVPIGKERLEYNGHRIYSPTTVIKNFEGLTLKEFIVINPDGELRQDLTLEDTKIYESWDVTYGCAVFIFKRS